MRRRRTSALGVAAVAVAAAIPVLHAAAQSGDDDTRHHGPMMMERGDPGMMGPQMRDEEEMMGRGRMGRDGPGRHMMDEEFGGPRYRDGPRVMPQVHLSKDDVRHYFRHWLERRGNDRLKVGGVNQRDDDTIVADIVTVKEAALVDRFAVDRHTGRISRVQ